MLLPVAPDEFAAWAAASSAHRTGAVLPRCPHPSTACRARWPRWWRLAVRQDWSVQRCGTPSRCLSALRAQPYSGASWINWYYIGS